MKIDKKHFIFICCMSLVAVCNTAAQTTNLSVREFEKMISQRDIQLLDVRTFAEYQNGHLGNALLADWNSEREFAERAKALDKTKPVYTYCLSGARSGAAVEWLMLNGFTAYNLDGGINAWRNADRPVVQSVEVKQLTMAEYLAQIPSGKTVLVDFGATWCAPCKKMAPVIDSLVALQENKFILVKIDGGTQIDICKELKIDAFPTFIIYKQGKVTWRKNGLVEIKEFEGNL